eukprot:jgi/Botrbrau1/3420/Bobra.139_1s0001.1
MQCSLLYSACNPLRFLPAGPRSSLRSAGGCTTEKCSLFSPAATSASLKTAPCQTSCGEAATVSCNILVCRPTCKDAFTQRTHSGPSARGGRVRVRAESQDREVRSLSPRNAPGETSSPPAQGQEGTKRGRGRPKGTAGWNKGISMSDATRRKISEGLRKRWGDPSFRSRVQDSLTGRRAWNKGLPMRDLTRRKISQQMRGRTVSEATRKLMSERAKLRAAQTPDARARQAELLKGRTLSHDHRLAIGATKRRKRMAASVYRAVEEAKQAILANSPDGSTPIPSLGSPLRLMESISKNGANSGPSSAHPVLEGYMAQLAEYRALQQELQSWVTAFEAQHHRKPSMKDVDRTGVPWLIDRWKQYLVVRQKIMADTANLRDKLQGVDTNGSPKGSAPGKAAPSPGTNVGDRIASAMAYKKRSPAPRPAATSLSPAVSPPASEGGVWNGAGDPADGSGAVEVPLDAPSSVKAKFLKAREYLQKKAQPAPAPAEAPAANAASPSPKSQTEPGAAVIVRGRPPRSRKDPMPATNAVNPGEQGNDEEPAVIKLAPLTSKHRSARAVSVGHPPARGPPNLVPSKDPGFHLAVSGITTEAPDAARAARLEMLRAEAEARLSRQPDSPAALQEV